MLNVIWLAAILLPLLLVLWAQRRLTRAYARAAAIVSRSGCTGRHAAAAILHAARIRRVAIIEVNGNLTDYYDPTCRRLGLSRPNFAGSNLAALAIAAHEAGHAVQQRVGSGLIEARHFFARVAQFGAPLGFVLAALGLVLGATPLLLCGGGALLVVAVVQLATVLIELDASRRAICALLTLGIITRAELPAVNAVLSASLVVYVVSLATFSGPLAHLLFRCFDSPPRIRVGANV